MTTDRNLVLEIKMFLDAPRIKEFFKDDSFLYYISELLTRFENLKEDLKQTEEALEEALDDSRIDIRYE